jgi:hypothetical protein
MGPSLDVEKVVIKKAVERGKHEGLDKDPKYLDPTYHMHGNFEAFSMYKCAYYQCYECKNPYFGGMKDCELN